MLRFKVPRDVVFELGGAGKWNFIIEGTNIISRFILGLSLKMKKGTTSTSREGVVDRISVRLIAAYQLLIWTVARRLCGQSILHL